MTILVEDLPSDYSSFRLSMNAFTSDTATIAWTDRQNIENRSYKFVPYPYTPEEDTLGFWTPLQHDYNLTAVPTWEDSVPWERAAKQDFYARVLQDEDALRTLLRPLTFYSGDQRNQLGIWNRILATLDGYWAGTEGVSPNASIPASDLISDKFMSIMDSCEYLANHIAADIPDHSDIEQIQAELRDYGIAVGFDPFKLINIYEPRIAFNTIEDTPSAVQCSRPLDDYETVPLGIYWGQDGEEKSLYTDPEGSRPRFKYIVKRSIGHIEEARLELILQRFRLITSQRYTVTVPLNLRYKLFDGVRLPLEYLIDTRYYNFIIVGIDHNISPTRVRTTTLRLSPTLVPGAAYLPVIEAGL